MMRWIPVLLSLSLAAAPPRAPKVFDRIGWLSGEDRVFMPFLAKDPVIVDLGQGQIRKKIRNAEGSSLSWSHRNATLYVMDCQPDDPKEIVRLKSLDAAKPESPWNTLGIVDETHGLPDHLVPLDHPNRFLAFGWMEGFTLEGKASFAAVFRLDPVRERLTLEKLVEMPFEDRPHVARYVQRAGQGDSGPTSVCLADPMRLHPNLFSPVINETHVLLAATGPGVIWAFSLKDGSCSRTLNLGGLKLDQLDKIDHINHHILGVQPLSGGDFMVATRHPEVLETALKLAPLERWGPMAAKARETFNTFTKDEGRIQWWRIDGTNLNAKKIDSVDQKGLRNLTYAQAGKLRFVVTHTDQVITNFSPEWEPYRSSLTADKPTPAPPAMPASPAPAQPPRP